jgi:hypothetical protein
VINLSTKCQFAVSVRLCFFFGGNTFCYVFLSMMEDIWSLRRPFCIKDWKEICGEGKQEDMWRAGEEEPYFSLICFWSVLANEGLWTSLF